MFETAKPFPAISAATEASLQYKNMYQHQRAGVAKCNALCFVLLVGMRQAKKEHARQGEKMGHMIIFSHSRTPKKKELELQVYGARLTTAVMVIGCCLRQSATSYLRLAPKHCSKQKVVRRQDRPAFLLSVRVGSHLAR